MRVTRMRQHRPHSESRCDLSSGRGHPRKRPGLGALAYPGRPLPSVAHLQVPKLPTPRPRALRAPCSSPEPPGRSRAASSTPPSRPGLPYQRGRRPLLAGGCIQLMPQTAPVLRMPWQRQRRSKLNKIRLVVGCASSSRAQAGC